MSGLILARAYAPRRGMCNVEELGNGFFRLTPDKNPLDRLIQHRSQIQWRKATVAH